MEFLPNKMSHGIPGPWKFVAIYMLLSIWLSVVGYAMADVALGLISDHSRGDSTSVIRT